MVKPWAYFNYLEIICNHIVKAESMLFLLGYYRRTSSCRSILTPCCPGRHTKVFCIIFSLFFFEQVTCHIVTSFDIMQNTALDLFYVTKIPFYIHQAQHGFRSGSGSPCLGLRQSHQCPEKIPSPESFQALCFPQTSCL